MMFTQQVITSPPDQVMTPNWQAVEGGVHQDPGSISRVKCSNSSK